MLSEKLANMAAGLAAIAASRRDFSEDARNVLDQASGLLSGYARDARALERHTVPDAVRREIIEEAGLVSLAMARRRRAAGEALALQRCPRCGRGHATGEPTCADCVSLTPPCDTEPGGAA